jgi:hypothetical protein
MLSVQWFATWVTTSSIHRELFFQLCNAIESILVLATACFIFATIILSNIDPNVSPIVSMI